MIEIVMKHNGDVFFKVEIVQDSQVLKCSWHGYTDVEKVKNGSNLLAFYLKSTESKQLFVDSRSEEGPWNDSQAWILDEWMPKVKALGLEKTAILTSKDMFSLVSAQEYERRSKMRGFKVKLFDNEQEALDWLIK
ncbi:MAG: hypothetical protein CL843_03975 [Crocinitomicaceae bacterium]|nr:hypothetical protein [Crocinitomicaceae bacterium]|tara:strand:- start:386 stop:790 length:405 start_codon:yes stop_codon:yes gene_type:complete